MNRVAILKRVALLRELLEPGDISRVAEEMWRPRSQKGRYSRQYVAAVARGERWNARIWERLWEVAMGNLERREKTEGLMKRISE